jgi:hypothetical protein
MFENHHINVYESINIHLLTCDAQTVSFITKRIHKKRLRLHTQTSFKFELTD